MFEFYEKSICNKTDSTSMPFRTFIDDICNKKIKKVNIFSQPVEDRKRAYTYTPTNNTVNVPLENWRNKKSMDNTVANNNNNNICKNQNLQKKSFEYNNNNNKKVQMNN